MATTMDCNQRQRLGLNIGAQYLPLLWPVWQSGAALEPNIVIFYLGLHTNNHFHPETLGETIE